MLKLYTNIKNMREEQGMSQEELAKRAGYTSRSSITKIEKGLVDLTQSKISAIAKALHTTPSVLMGWEEPNKNDIHTLAAHFEGEEYTEEELEEIYNFAEFVKNKRK